MFAPIKAPESLQGPLPCYSLALPLLTLTLAPPDFLKASPEPAMWAFTVPGVWNLFPLSALVTI